MLPLDSVSDVPQNLVTGLHLKAPTGLPSPINGKDKSINNYMLKAHTEN